MNGQPSSFNEKIAIAAVTSFFSAMTVGLTVGLPLYFELMKAKIDRERAITTIVATSEKADAAIIKAEEAVTANVAAIQNTNDRFDEFRDVVAKGAFAEGVIEGKKEAVK